MAYKYKRALLKELIKFRDECHVPTEWLDTQESEAIFRAGMQGEFQAITNKIYCAWVYVRDEKNCLCGYPGPRGKKSIAVPLPTLPVFCCRPPIASPGKFVALVAGMGFSVTKSSRPRINSTATSSRIRRDAGGDGEAGG